MDYSGASAFIEQAHRVLPSQVVPSEQPVGLQMLLSKGSISDRDSQCSN